MNDGLNLGYEVRNDLTLQSQSYVVPVVDNELRLGIVRKLVESMEEGLWPLRATVFNALTEVAHNDDRTR